MLIESPTVLLITTVTLTTLPATSTRTITAMKWILMATMINCSTNYPRKILQNISDTKFARKTSIQSWNSSFQTPDVTTGHIKFQLDLLTGRRKKNVRSKNI